MSIVFQTRMKLCGHNLFNLSQEKGEKRESREGACGSRNFTWGLGMGAEKCRSGSLTDILFVEENCLIL